MEFRILAVVLLAASVLFMPFWVSIILALISIAYFPIFIEAVILLSLSDFLYGVQEARFFNYVSISLIISIVFLVGAEIIKKKLRFYK